MTPDCKGRIGWRRIPLPSPMWKHDRRRCACGGALWPLTADCNVHRITIRHYPIPPGVLPSKYPLTFSYTTFNVTTQPLPAWGHGP